MFDLIGNDRIAEWKNFRNGIETSSTPLQDVVLFWSKAPFVNSYLDCADPLKWPDPWRLVIDNRYDDLAISLGIAYTLKLTTRFMNEQIEIHMSILEKEKKFPVVIRDCILNWNYREVIDKKSIFLTDSTLLFIVPTL